MANAVPHGLILSYLRVSERARYAQSHKSAEEGARQFYDGFRRKSQMAKELGLTNPFDLSDIPLTRHGLEVLVTEGNHLRPTVPP